jgi:hypothetical protein
MNRDDITEMAREAGLYVPRSGIPENGALTRFVALVAAQERECCAKICDGYNNGRYTNLADLCADDIRARNNT